MNINSFPKIFALGTTYISNIFDDEVEITEKIDGSQFVFGKLGGELVMRSKGTMIHDYMARAKNDLFYPAIQHVMKVQDKIPDGMVFYCETLCRPKHNTLKYGQTPKNNLALFAASEGKDVFISNHHVLCAFAEQLDIDVVPLLYCGKVDSPEFINELMGKESVLGEAEAEGVVVKNYKQPFLLGGQPIPVMAGKFVSEKFKEVHCKNWTKENTGAGKWQLFKDAHRTEARWEKAVQHLAEAGQLDNQPRDIGKLVAEVQRDITEEEIDNIKAFLWKEFGGELLRTSIKGLPEWYKQRLLDSSFSEGC